MKKNKKFLILIVFIFQITAPNGFANPVNKSLQFIAKHKMLSGICTILWTGMLYTSYLLKNYCRLRSLVICETPKEFCSLAKSYITKPMTQSYSTYGLKHDIKLHTLIANRLHSLEMRSLPDFYDVQADIIKCTLKPIKMPLNEAASIYSKISLQPTTDFSGIKKRLNDLRNTQSTEEFQFFLRQASYLFDSPFERQNFDAVCTNKAAAEQLQNQTLDDSLKKQIRDLAELNKRRRLNLADKESDMRSNHKRSLICRISKYIGWS